ncbi:MAG: S16 family serine protease [Acholeplasmataceae bacterium]|nr:S16 family serine protease [Acholeplasmataceae bacterium]
MLKLLKNYKKILIILSFPYLYLLFVLVAPTNMAVTAPGGLSPVDSAIVIDTVDFLDNFNTVYVYSYYPITAFQSFVLTGDETMNVKPMTVRETDTSWRDDFRAGQISKIVSLKTSLIKAYELANIEDPSILIDYEYRGLYIYYRPSRLTELEVGDIIVEVNGNSYKNYTHQEFRQLAYLTTIRYKVMREVNGVETFFMFDYTKVEEDQYMIFYPNYEIISASPSFEFPGVNSIVGGPSGGMIQTLSIYASLLKLNFGNLKIAGTGTIEIDGTVGRIGGITQKMYTGIYNKIDVFFMPTSHFSEIPNLDYPYEIIVVDTIEQAVQALHDLINE